MKRLSNEKHIKTARFFRLAKALQNHAPCKSLKTKTTTKTPTITPMKKRGKTALNERFSFVVVLTFIHATHSLYMRFVFIKCFLCDFARFCVLSLIRVFFDFIRRCFLLFCTVFEVVHFHFIFLGKTVLCALHCKLCNLQR